jgi:hypothetical protein
MPDRPIVHVIPVDDGYDHDIEDCLCGVTIHQVDGLAPVGTPGRPGALTFTHNKMAETSRWQIVEEIDEEAPSEA